MTKKNKQWSINDLIYLKQNPKVTAPILAKQLGRTEGSIRFMRTKLKADPDYIDKQAIRRQEKHHRDKFNDDAEIEFFKERKIASKRHKPLKLELGARYYFYRKDGTGFDGCDSIYIEEVEGVPIKEYSDFYLIQCDNYKTTINRHCAGYKIRRLDI